jgi:hypothetical protein
VRRLSVEFSSYKLHITTSTLVFAYHTLSSESFEVNCPRCALENYVKATSVSPLSSYYPDTDNRITDRIGTAEVALYQLEGLSKFKSLSKIDLKLN